MDKIYLILKTKISLMVQDNWALFVGDMLVFEKIGTKTVEKRREYNAPEYITSDVYRLNYFEYSQTNFQTGKVSKLLNECNSIDVSIKVSKPNYSETQWLRINNIFEGLEDYKIHHIFEDVSKIYNREDKLNKILNG